MGRLRNSLMTKWFLSFILVILILLIVFEVSFSLYIRNYYYNLVHEKLHSTLTSNTQFINNYYVNSGMVSKDLADQISESFGKSKNYIIEVLDKDKAVLSTPIKTSENIVFPFDSNTYSLDNYKDQKLMVLYSPIVFEGSIIGYLRLITTINEIDEIIKRDIITSLFIASGILIMLMMLSFVFLLSVIKPINKLVDLTKEYSNGKWDESIEIKSKDELATLGDSMMFMAQKIKYTQIERDKFIATISHDLRTPLTSMLGWCELIEKGNLDSENIQIASQTISAEAKRLTGLVNTLIDFNKEKKTDISINPIYTNVNNIIKEVVNLYEPKIRRYNGKINMNLTESVYHNIDIDKFKQVLVNLFDNAIKYSKDNLILTVNLFKDDDTTVIKLKDNGIGIAAGDLKRIKESFFRVDYSSEEGLGLGLYISEDIIKKHNGRLDIASIEGDGTEITIMLK